VGESFRDVAMEALRICEDEANIVHMERDRQRRSQAARLLRSFIPDTFRIDEGEGPEVIVEGYRFYELNNGLRMAMECPNCHLYLDLPCGLTMSKIGQAIRLWEENKWDHVCDK